MDKKRLREQLKALKARKDSLRKRIISISGPASTKLSRELDEIEERISDIESKLGKGGDSHVPFGKSPGEDDGKRTLSTPAGRGIPPSLSEEIAQLRGQVRWLELAIVIIVGRRRLRVLSICLILVGLVPMWLYLRGLTSSTDETRPIGNQDVDAIIIYPLTLTKGKWQEIRCVATRRNSVFSSKVFIELIRPSNDFHAKNGVWGHEFDFSKASSPKSLDWPTEIKYEPSGSWLRELSRLVSRQHIDAELKDADGKTVDEVCMSLQINTFYSALLWLLTWSGGLFAIIKSEIIDRVKSACKKWPPEDPGVK